MTSFQIPFAMQNPLDRLAAAYRNFETSISGMTKRSGSLLTWTWWIRYQIGWIRKCEAWMNHHSCEEYCLGKDDRPPRKLVEFREIESFFYCFWQYEYLPHPILRTPSESTKPSNSSLVEFLWQKSIEAWRFTKQKLLSALSPSVGGWWGRSPSVPISGREFFASRVLGIVLCLWEDSMSG